MENRMLNAAMIIALVISVLSANFAGWFTP
jgi:hypothetical protein